MKPAKPAHPLKLIDPRMAYIAKNPGTFALSVLKDFQANQGLLQAGAIAYYALLSIVPMLILLVIVLSHVVDRTALLDMLRIALEYVAPGQGRAVVAELVSFLDGRQAVGWVLFVTMLFFSSLGFKVLEGAISVIFLHRIEQRKRHFLVSLVLLPFGYILFVAVGLFVATVLSVDLAALGDRQVAFLGHIWSLNAFARELIYVFGVLGEILLISAIYYFMPVGRLTVRHALIGGVTASLLWELIRHALGWYLGTLSQVNLVYGSLATAIIVMLSMELAATILLLGAQVIARYERIETGE
ncbi:MAG TPA: YihY/virulence factor BrkB family protein [Gallionellaceae bacterium]